VCAPSSRRERYNVASLMQQYGDAKLTDLLQTLERPPAAPPRCAADYEEA
jgi:hypothetical protein